MSRAWADKARRALARRIGAPALAPRRDAGVLSISFDDFPKSAWEEGGRVLRDHGVRATYFACGALCGERFENQVMYDHADLAALFADGHEVGCHSFDHKSALRLNARDLVRGFGENARFVRETLGDVRLVSFAYPYGDATLAAKRAAMRVFACARGVDAGLNRRRIDLAQLKAVGLEAERGGLDFVLPFVAAAARERAWLIVYSHDVSDRPGRFGCKPEELDQLIREARAAGLEILTVKDGLAARTSARA
jgi:peptidoglycan/xylan/chitin deacetylase (PgdA/CDA1 family)